MVKMKHILLMNSNKARMSTVNPPVQYQWISQCIKERKGDKKHMFWEEWTKLSLNVGSMIVYVENPKKY